MRTQESDWRDPPLDPWDWNLPLVSLVWALSAMQNLDVISIGWLLITSPLWLPVIALVAIRIAYKIYIFRQRS